MARRTESRDPGITHEVGELISNITSDPATTVASRNTMNWRRGEYGVYDELMLEFTTIAGRMGECSKITDVLFYDASAGTYRDMLGPPQGSNSAMLFRGEDDSAVEQFVMDEDVDFLYIGTMRRVGGFEFTLDASLVNDDASTMVFEISSGTGFVVSAVTDGTDSSGDSFKQSGVVEITAVPSEADWHAKALNEIDGVGHPDVAKKATGGIKRYWSRISQTSVSGAPLDAVEIEQLSALLITVADTTGTADAGLYKLNQVFTKDIHHAEIGALEFWAQSGTTADLELTWFKYP